MSEIGDFSAADKYMDNVFLYHLRGGSLSLIMSLHSVDSYSVMETMEHDVMKTDNAKRLTVFKMDAIIYHLSGMTRSKSRTKC